MGGDITAGGNLHERSKAVMCSLCCSCYFAVVTLTTVGYGDLHPTTDETRLFTIAYIFVGLGVFVALLASIAQEYIKQKAEAPSARDRLGKLQRRRSP